PLFCQASGVKILDEVLQAFNEVKTRHTSRYLLLGLVNSDREIGVLKKAPLTAPYEEFLADLKAYQDQGRGVYGVYDIEYELESKQKRNKLVFVSWGPDNLPIRQRMLIASSKNDLRRKLQGVHKEMQASELGEITEDCMIEVCRQGDLGSN
uniref:ADF-H domain-containing protein n=2 Tax=Macrostomum lignano TaxID=282301 RepID=A0A1I8J284_9PLAT